MIPTDRSYNASPSTNAIIGSGDGVLGVLLSLDSGFSRLRAEESRTFKIKREGLPWTEGEKFFVSLLSRLEFQ